MATAKILYKKNSQFLKISGLKDTSVTPSVFLNAATAILNMVDPSGVAVPGFTNVTGTYTPASSGEYIFPVNPTTFDPIAQGGYTIQITATQSGKQWYVELPAKVVVRKLGTET